MYYLSRPSIINASAIETTDVIGVYWNAQCTQIAAVVNWGTFFPGETKTFTVYVRNEGVEPIALTVTSINWSPANVSSALRFSWACSIGKLDVWKVSRVTLTMSAEVASQYAGTETTFSFVIYFEGLDHFLGDINRDGVVDMHDIGAICGKFATKKGDVNWNPNVDLNKDGIISMADIGLVLKDYGKRWNSF
jgi:hypothetical protein